MDQKRGTSVKHIINLQLSLMYSA